MCLPPLTKKTTNTKTALREAFPNFLIPLDCITTPPLWHFSPVPSLGGKEQYHHSTPYTNQLSLFPVSSVHLIYIHTSQNTCYLLSFPALYLMWFAFKSVLYYLLHFRNFAFLIITAYFDFVFPPLHQCTPSPTLKKKVELSFIEKISALLFTC